jgi:peptidyl-prolyl cis-trans isomerase D
MLQSLRDKTSGWIATVILGLLVVPFAFFGMEQYLFQRNETFAAKIEAPPAWWPTAPSAWPVTMLWQRDEISVEDFRAAFERTRQQQRQQQGVEHGPSPFRLQGSGAGHGTETGTGRFYRVTRSIRSASIHCVRPQIRRPS